MVTSNPLCLIPAESSVQLGESVNLHFTWNFRIDSRRPIPANRLLECVKECDLEGWSGDTCVLDAMRMTMIRALLSEGKYEEKIGNTFIWGETASSTLAVRMSGPSLNPKKHHQAVCQGRILLQGEPIDLMFKASCQVSADLGCPPEVYMTHGRTDLQDLLEELVDATNLPYTISTCGIRGYYNRTHL